MIKHTRGGPCETSADNGGLLSTDDHPRDTDAGMWLQRNSLNRRPFHALIPPGWPRSWQRYLTVPAFVIDGRSGCTRTQGDEYPPHIRAPVPLDHAATAAVFLQSDFQLPAGGHHRCWDVVRNNGPARHNPGGLA